MTSRGRGPAARARAAGTAGTAGTARRPAASPAVTATHPAKPVTALGLSVTAAVSPGSQALASCFDHGATLIISGAPTQLEALTISSSTGAISGTPTTAGTFGPPYSSQTARQRSGSRSRS
ncbi:MAG TPA: hypothetical protein VFO01_16350 [Trebonia sp.]|nr:hypothetical protein [Trebonia sp.]